MQVQRKYWTKIHIKSREINKVGCITYVLESWCALLASCLLASSSISEVLKKKIHQVASSMRKGEG